jgi:uncharacterized protein (TIGR02145 family)
MKTTFCSIIRRDVACRVSTAALAIVLAMSATTLRAQVTIGSLDEPKATLDVVAVKTDGSTAEGIIAPRLDRKALNDKEAKYTSAQKGAIVYVTSVSNGTATGQAIHVKSVGYYYFDGTVWVRIRAADAGETVLPLKVATQPAPFTFSRFYDSFGDPNAPASFSTTLNVVVTGGAGSYTYQWYMADESSLWKFGTVGSNSASYNFVQNSSGVANWGLRKFYCEITDAAGNKVRTDEAEIALGTGAKTTDGRWLKFAAYNLGADTSLDPFAYGTSANDTTSNDIKGFIFQWGRVADGHQWRSSSTVAGPVYLPSQYQVPSSGTSDISTSLGISSAQTYANYYGKFITASDFEFFYDWRTPQIGWIWYSWGGNGNDPCYNANSNWQLPTQSDWATIIGDNGFSRQTPQNATANTWKLAESGSGYEIKPDGSTTALFLPAAGYRNDNGTLDSVGTRGYYWSSTASASGAFNLGFNSGIFAPGDAYSRAIGRSVRCVQSH